MGHGADARQSLTRPQAGRNERAPAAERATKSVLTLRGPALNLCKSSSRRRRGRPEWPPDWRPRRGHGRPHLLPVRRGGPAQSPPLRRGRQHSRRPIRRNPETDAAGARESFPHEIGPDLTRGAASISLGGRARGAASQPRMLEGLRGQGRPCPLPFVAAAWRRPAAFRSRVCKPGTPTPGAACSSRPGPRG
jgi:hypothetical protein